MQWGCSCRPCSALVSVNVMILWSLCQHLPNAQIPFWSSGWLFGSSRTSSSKKKKNKHQELDPYESPAEKAERLKEGRAIDLAALLELKQLIQHEAVAFFSTWVADGNPCDFAKVFHSNLALCSLLQWIAMNLSEQYIAHIA